jgi:hypothetical protein
LASNGTVKSGYVVNAGPGLVLAPSTLAANTCNGSGADAVPTYFGEAHPVSVSSGTRSFGTDQRATIFGDVAGGTYTAVSVDAAPDANALQ